MGADLMCQPCADRRRAILDAILAARIAEAVRLAAEGVKDMIRG